MFLLERGILIMGLELSAALSALKGIMNSNTTTIVFDKIKNAKADQNKDRTIQQLQEIINELITEKSELITIASVLESEVSAQKISEEDIQFISDSLLPVLEDVLSSSESDSQKINENISAIKPILSKETFMILQTLGFNFKEAVGGPLTDLVSTWIRNKIPQNKRNSTNPGRKK